MGNDILIWVLLLWIGFGIGQIIMSIKEKD